MEASRHQEAGARGRSRDVLPRDMPAIPVSPDPADHQTFPDRVGIAFRARIRKCIVYAYCTPEGFILVLARYRDPLIVRCRQCQFAQKMDSD